MADLIEKVASIAQDIQDKENANDPVVKNSINIVKHFIQHNRVMCYGGTAINNLLPKEDRFYDSDRDIPDYDFFSQTPQQHAMKLADILMKAGIPNIQVKPGIHLGTFKVFADFIGVADVTHLESEIFDILWSEAIQRDSIRYVPPNFLRMSMYLELSRPRGDVSRWKKIYNRLSLLNKHYPIKCPAKDLTFHDEVVSDSIKTKIEHIMKQERCILLGINAFNLQQSTQSGWTLPLDMLVTPEKINQVSKSLKTIFEPERHIKIKQLPKDPHTLPEGILLIDVKSKKLLFRIYQTEACHSYHKTSGELYLASIPTILNFFFGMIYAVKNKITGNARNRLICNAQRLIDMANGTKSRRFKLLTPIECVGKQQSLTDMLEEKSRMYKELSKNRKSAEFIEYFFSYIPEETTPAKKKELKQLLDKVT